MSEAIHISAERYATLKAQLTAYNAVFRNGMTTEQTQALAESLGLERPPTNEERSAVEVFEFIHSPPERYFLYINPEKRIATTWTGERLGSVSFGREWRDNFGGTRQSVTIHAINGKRYSGTYYKSSGDYARIKMLKS